MRKIFEIKGRGSGGGASVFLVVASVIGAQHAK
jgi:hypothetical protein